MTTRKVKIASLNVTVEVPIYLVDWVKFVAVDADGSAWMYSHAPVVSGDQWKVLVGDYDILPAASSERPHNHFDMFGIDWKSTLTAVH